MEKRQMKIHEPPMTFKDDEARQGWEKGVANNQDPYGNAVYRYASEWATRMEKVCMTDADVALHAQKTSHEADDEGITGFMYGCAVSILSQAWIHGEALRKWNNLDLQIGNEGEKANEKEGAVLNPALLSFDSK